MGVKVKALDWRNSKRENGLGGGRGEGAIEEEDKKKRRGREHKRERKHDILGKRESVACQTSPRASLWFFKYPCSAFLNMKDIMGY